MTNMIYARKGASIVEFPLHPHVDRCYGHMAMALDMDYWVFPPLHAFYHGVYTITPGIATQFQALLQHVAIHQGLISKDEL